MKLESELYHLFRSLIKFLKNENFIEYYQHLINLKKSIRKILESLFDFGLILGTSADKSYHEFSNNNNTKTTFYQRTFNIFQDEVKPRGRGSKFEEQSIINDLNSKVYLKPNKIQRILLKVKESDG